MICNLSRIVCLPVFCFLSMAAFLFSSPAFGKDLYVNASTGSDSYTWAQNDSSHPWVTLTRACALAVAGDTVYVLPGTYTGTASNGWATPAFHPAASGTSESNRITFIGTAGVVLRTNMVNMGPIIGANTRNYITWKNFVIDENNYTVATGDFHPIVASASAYVTFDNVDVIGRNKAGNDGDLHCGIRINGATYTTVKNCRIYNVSTGGGPTGLNTAGILMYNANNITIENNEIYNTNAGIFIKSNSNYVTMRYNYIHDLTNVGIAITVGASNASVYQNIITTTRAGIYHSVTGSAAGSVIYNNTIVNSTSNDAELCSATVGLFTGPVTYYNNIVHGGRCSVMIGGGIGYEIPVSFHHNNYYGYSASGWYINTSTSQTFAQWQAGVSGGDSGSILSNPLFVNVSTRDYHLQAGSPARTASNSGGAIGAYITGTETIGLPGMGMPQAPVEGSTSSGGGGGCSITGIKVDSINASSIVYLLFLIAPAILLFVRYP